MGGPDSFTRWSLSWPEQAVLTAHAIVWSAGAEEAIKRMAAVAAEEEEGEERDATRGTRAFLRHCAAQLEEVVAYVRRADAEAKVVSTKDRKTLRSLIIVSVHAKYGKVKHFLF